MANDWIKWNKGLTRRREVLSIAHKVGCDHRIVAACCMLLWEWADDETTDGHIGGVPVGFIDRLVGLDGFSDAMVEVGWLRVSSGGVTVPNWDHHNGKSAKRRAKNARSQALGRSADECQHSVSKMSPKARDNLLGKRREEKRREEKHASGRSEDPTARARDAPTQPAGQPSDHWGDIFAALERWKGATLTTSEEYAVRQFADKLGDDALLLAAVSNAIESQAGFHTSNRAVKYLQAICERCRRESVKPGEFEFAGDAQLRAAKANWDRIMARYGAANGNTHS